MALSEVPVRAGALGRTAAALALVSAVVHVLLLDATDLASLAMAGLALACLPCGWHLWRRPTAAVWALTAAVDGAMLLVHARLLAGGPAAGMPGMVHAASPPALVWAGLGLVTGQLLLAGAAGLRR